MKKADGHRRLSVWWDGEEGGTLHLKKEKMVFFYSAEWRSEGAGLRSPGRFPCTAGKPAPA